MKKVSKIFYRVYLKRIKTSPKWGGNVLLVRLRFYDINWVSILEVGLNSRKFNPFEMNPFDDFK
jgi:hypothetical protein